MTPASAIDDRAGGTVRRVGNCVTHELAGQRSVGNQVAHPTCLTSKPCHPALRTGRTARTDRRRRGSVYLTVLGSATLVMVIGLSALAAARVHHRQATSVGDFAKARFYALSAIDLALLAVQDDSGWKALIQSGAFLPARAIGDGTFSLDASFIDDGDGDWTDDAVLLTGIGYCGQARYKLQVQLDVDGDLVPGTWQQVVD